VRRITGKWRVLVETPDDFGAFIAGHAKVRDPIARFVARAASPTGPIRRQFALARWADQQIEEILYPIRRSNR
jgi:hypothetical protein